MFQYSILSVAGVAVFAPLLPVNMSFSFYYDRYRFTEDSMATDIPSMARALYWPMPSSPGLGGVATPISTMRNSGGQTSARTTVNEPACTLLLYTSLAIP